MRSRKSPLFLSLSLSLAGFLLILFCLNLYQYLRVKNDIASTMLQEINAKEMEELRSFFSTIGEKLNIVRDWGKNGVLDNKETITLNKKFFPLINHQKRISGILLADDTGWEYYLVQQGDEWLTKEVRASGDGRVAIYKKWKDPENLLSTERKPTRYDPRKRPWFHRSENRDEIFWTPLYTFAETGQPGITATVSWDSTARKNGYYVFGIDISIAEIRTLISANQKQENSLIFLVNNQGNTILTGQNSVVDKTNDRPEEILTPLVKQWQELGKPSKETIRFSWKNKQWLGSLQPLVQDNAFFWIGVAAPEKDLLSKLHTLLFRVDLTDVLVATGGGMLLLLLIWKNGGFRQNVSVNVDPVIHLHSLINQGEGARVEFKSTARTNLKTGKKGKEIELAWLKSLVAFLNSSGGTLLIGVDDAGRILGIKADNFDNSDRCLLHIKNLINQHIGAEFSGFINILLVDADEEQVIMIEVERAGQPVFLKIGKNEEFYIRSGPSSIKLSPSQMLSYVFQNKLRVRQS